MKKFLIFFLTAGVSLSCSALPSFAATSCGSSSCPPTLLSGLGVITVIINVMIAISVIVFFFMLVIGGFNFITAGGDKKKIEAAQKSIFYSVIGFALIFLPFIIIPLIGQFTQIKSSLSVSNNGTISLNVGSTFTATPLPPGSTSSVTPLPTNPPSSGGSGSSGLGQSSQGTFTNGCTFEFVGDVPIFYQWPPTDFWKSTTYGGPWIAQDGNGVSVDGGPTDVCRTWGSYGDPSVGDIWHTAACAPGVALTIANTYLHRFAPETAYPDLTTSVNDMISTGGEVIYYDNHHNPFGSGYLPGPNNPGDIVQTINDLANQALHFVLADEIGSSSGPDKTSANWAKIVKAATAGYPIILSMPNHYLTLLSGTVGGRDYVADTGPITGGTSSYTSGAFEKNGVQSLDDSVLYSNWEGHAYLIEPAQASGKFN